MLVDVSTIFWFQSSSQKAAAQRTIASSKGPCCKLQETITHVEDCDTTLHDIYERCVPELKPPSTSIEQYIDRMWRLKVGVKATSTRRTS